MEQDEFVYEYQMGKEIFRFEAHGDGEANKYRQYAVLHFKEKLGSTFSEGALVGPRRIDMNAEAESHSHSPN